jgi:hypothetical protein
MSNVPPNLNDILFSFFTGRRAGTVPDWLYEKNTEVEYTPRPYSELVAEFGWAGVKKHLEALSKKLKIGVEFVAQRILLDAFGMPELACYDGRVRDFVKFLPTSGNYEKGVLMLYSELVNLLEDQLKRGGSTLYFNLETLSTKRCRKWFCLTNLERLIYFLFGSQAMVTKSSQPWDSSDMCLNLKYLRSTKH